MSRAFERIDKGIQIKPLDSGPASTSSNPSDNIEGSLWVVQNELRMYLDSAIRSLVTSNQTQTLSNKTLDNSNSITVQDSNLTLQDNVDNTKQANFDLSALTTASTRTYTMPDDDCVIVGDDSTQTLTNKTLVVANNTITTAASGNLIATELNAALAELQGDIDTINGDLPVGDIVGTTDVQTLTNKTIDGDDNTLQDISITSLKTDAGSPNTVITRDGSGAVIDTKASPTGDFVGTSDTQTLTNKTIDGDDNTVQDLALSSLKTEVADASKFIERDGSGVVISGKSVPTGDVVGTSDSQVLTGKDIDGGTASNTSRITLPKDTKTNLDSLTRKEGTLLYATDEDKVYYDDGSNLLAVGSGEGSGGINYVTNPDAEVDASDWSAYADAAQATPVDGTGGSPTVTLARTTSSPLRGSGSFLLTKDAANRQGEGASTDLTIDSADQTKVLRVSFDYDNTGANYVDGDIRVFIYDVTNSQLIEPTQRDLLATSTKGTYISEFQASSNSTSYRLILHIATTNASAYTLKFDNVQVGPREIARGPVMSDFESLDGVTNTITTNATTSARYKRIGDEAEVEVLTEFTGANTDGVYEITLPFSIDTTKTEFVLNQTVFGTALVFDSSVLGYHGRVCAGSASNKLRIIMFADDVGAGSQYIGGGVYTTASGPMTIANGDYVLLNFKVPISGWSSNVQVSSDFGSRRIVVRGAGNGNTVLTASTTNIDWTEVEDTTASWNGTQFTAPEKGDYNVTAHLNFASAYGGGIDMFINNVNIKKVGRGVGAGDMGFSATASLNKGDILSFRATAGVTLSNDTINHNIHIQKIDSRQIYASNEVVAMRARLSTDTAVNAAIIPFDATDIDTHDALNTSTGVYTVPGSGKYRVTTSSLIIAGSQNAVQIRKNTVSIQAFFTAIGNTTVVNGSALLDCVKGDTIDIFGLNNVTYDTSSAIGPQCSFEIEKIN